MSARTCRGAGADDQAEPHVLPKVQVTNRPRDAGNTCMTRTTSFAPAMLGTFWGRWGRRGRGGPRGRVGVDTAAPSCRRQSGGGRSRRYCDATCRLHARRTRAAPTPARWAAHWPGPLRAAALLPEPGYDQRGAAAAHTCAEHRELTRSCCGRECLAGASWIGWLPAGLGGAPADRHCAGCAPADLAPTRRRTSGKRCGRTGCTPASASVRSLHPSHGHVSSRTIVCSLRGSRVVDFK